MRASFLPSLVLLAACTVANPAYETGESAADTIAAETTQGPGPTSGGDTLAPPPTTGAEGTVTSVDGTTNPVEDTGVASSDTGVESCLPVDPGRALDVRVLNTFDETCAGPELITSVVNLARIPGTDHFTGRVCPIGCGDGCLIMPSDQELRIEMPADLALALDQASCIDLHASVDHEDECRVDHFAMWFSGQDGKTPELVGATVEANPRLIGTDVLPLYSWGEVEPCGEQCSDFNKYPGVWKIAFEGGYSLEHNTNAPSIPLVWVSANTAQYDVRDLQSYIGEDCLSHMAWVGQKL